MLFDRDSGILLHVSALPGEYGIGDFGPDCIHWLDILRNSGQSLWQILPLGPTGYGDSPYQSSSSFAINSLFLSPELLCRQGLLKRQVCEAARHPRSKRVPFGDVYLSKEQVVYQAFESFTALPISDPARQRFEEFKHNKQDWLEDYALYSILKARHNSRPWSQWPATYRDRNQEALQAFSQAMKDEIERVKCVQFWLHEQWQEVRAEAHKRGIRIVGDLPIFVAHDSVDVWANRDLFLLNQDGSPTSVAGVPPDYFSATGQLWGNPIYDWQRHQSDNFTWWLKRVESSLAMADVIRIDHFRGFASTWQVPGNETTAINGAWVPVPGRHFFETLRNHYKGRDLPIIAEDLGVITPDVVALRDDFGLPGIRILQFAFGDDPMSHTFLPEAYENNCVAYSGTHDNDTIVGWFNAENGEGSTRDNTQIAKERANVLNYFNSTGEDIHIDFIKALYRSEAGAVILPLQDVMGLGSHARFNLPGTASNNWHWRLERYDDALPHLINLGQLSAEYARNGIQAAAI